MNRVLAVLLLITSNANAGNQKSVPRIAQHTYIPGVSTVTVTSDGWSPYPYEVLERSKDPADYENAPVPELQPVVNALMSRVEHKVVAVSDVRYSDGRDSADGGVIAAKLTLALTNNLPLQRVVERAQIAQVLEEIKFQHSGAVDESRATEMGKMLGADLLVMGTLTEMTNTKLQLSLRLVEVKTGEVIAAKTMFIKKDWATPKRPEKEGPVSLSQVETVNRIERLPPGGASVLLQPLKPKKYDPVTGAIYLGSGCGFDIYYEGDGTFMAWSRGKPHGIGGSGYYIKRTENQYCDYAMYITAQIQYKHPELLGVWRQYRRDNGF